jgi:aminoglycoside 3-N-acetyltransferase
MLHASLRRIGPVIGGPDEIHLAVSDAIAPGGSAMMVVGCPDGYDDVGRGILTEAQEAELLEHLPPFDPATGRAQRALGALAELFRSAPGTVTSHHAGVRIAARGARAQWLVADQPWDWAFGRGSPFDKLVHERGKVLLLGSDHDEVTLMHYVEHVADFPGKRVTRYQVPMLVDGRRAWVACLEYNSGAVGVHPSWPDRFFALIVDDFIARHGGTAACATGKVGEADSVLMDAAALVAHATPIMQRQAAGEIVFAA